MSWSPQQEQAIKAVRAWINDKTAPQVFRLFGYAGSGKTTLARELAKEVRGVVLFAAFTGKASLVLSAKGCDGARTIHSLIYKPETDEKTGITTFKINRDSAVAYASLIVVDEVSMVGEDLALDLLGFGTKILVLGDPAQLPPVKGEGYFINASPDFMLTEVHRQAQDNPIIRMSMDVREGRGLTVGQYGDSLVARRADIDKETLRGWIMAADQALCGLNRTRQTFNDRIRALKGLNGDEAPYLPVAGDKLVCLKNNRNKGLMNGGLWEVTKTGLGISCQTVEMRVKSLDNPVIAHQDVSTPIQFFVGTEKEMDWRDLRRADQFTYGYTLTVHKSQGSQWDNVLLFDESSVFRDDAKKHLYTGITRAAEQIKVLI